MKEISSEIIKSLFLSLITISILTGVYYLNLEEEKISQNDYFKSDICYYALNGIKSDYHYHFQLNITINNEKIVIPENIGFEKNENDKLVFLHPIHTYDNSGRIHVETTKNTTAKLEFLFQIWNVEFNSNQIFEYETNNDYEVIMKVNNEEVHTFEETLLEPYIFIEIDYKKID